MSAVIPQSIIIKNIDLYNKKYSIEILEKNIYNLSILIILRTQLLTPDFCVKYILSEEYASTNEETYICDFDVLRHQPHITQQDLYHSRRKLASPSLTTR